MRDLFQGLPIKMYLTFMPHSLHFGIVRQKFDIRLIGGEGSISGENRNQFFHDIMRHEHSFTCQTCRIRPDFPSHKHTRFVGPVTWKCNIYLFLSELVNSGRGLDVFFIIFFSEILTQPNLIWNSLRIFQFDTQNCIRSSVNMLQDIAFHTNHSSW